MARRIGFFVGLALFVWILSRADLLAVWREVSRLRWGFGFIVFFYGLIFALDTLGWRFAMPGKAKKNVSWGALFRTRLAGEAVNYVTPTGYIGGEPVKALILQRRHGIPMREGMASVVIAKTTLTFSMLLFVAAGVAVTLSTQSMDAAVLRWVWIILPVMSVLMALFLAAQFLQPFHRGSKLVDAVTSWIRLPRFSGWLEKVTGRLKEWDREIISFYRKSPGLVLGSLGFHFLGWVAGAAEVFVILRLLGIEVTWATAFSIEALWVLLKSATFLIPASIGASEGIVLLVCGGVGVSAVPGLALGLLRRAREVIWVVLGLFEFARMGPGWAKASR